MTTAASQPPLTLSNVLPQKHIGSAYKLLIFLGVLGVHRFYLGKVGTGILWLCTGGVLGIGVLVDIFTLDRQVLETNQRNAVAPTLR